MDVISSWPGRLAVFLVVFPVVMFVLPYAVAALRQRLTWNKRLPADAALLRTPSKIRGAPGDPELDDLLRRPSDRHLTT